MDHVVIKQRNFIVCKLYKAQEKKIWANYSLGFWDLLVLLESSDQNAVLVLYRRRIYRSTLLVIVSFPFRRLILEKYKKN